ncbi:tetratricopeptide repeat-containing sensor histidine kinase [uncultured Aquimarina sp.]|uniref:tetratricopeptide repeat-containing sensor histidine kinase n=1 Tax=uncultured Aquimarina sp. TaxID=575652 RepID=UPI00261D1CD9|nr:tetratricopeptide repeat-containing sensor histidine kinase [uncultured Aquimarina sp.]
MIKVKDIFIFIFCLTNINIYTQSLEDHCDLWRKQKDTITSSESLSKLNSYIINKVDDACKFEIYIASGSLYTILGKSNFSLEYFNKAEKIAEKLNDSLILLKAYSEKAYALAVSNANDKEVLKYLNKIRLVLENNPENENWLPYYDSLAQIARGNEDYFRAIKYTDTLITFLKKFGYTAGLPNRYQNRGLYYFNMSNYEAAAKDLLHSIELNEKLGSPILIEDTYYFLGLSYLKWKQYDVAIKYLEKSISIAKVKENYKTLIFGFSDLSKCFLESNHIDKSITYVDSALYYNKLLKNDLVQAEVLNQKGNIFFKGYKELDDAENLFTESFELANVSKDRKVLYISTLSLIELYNDKKEYNKSSKYISILRKISKQRDILLWKQRSYKIYSEYFEGIRQFDSAMRYLKKYYKIKDSVSNQQVQTKVADLEKKYDTKKKELKIVTLNKQKEEQERIAQQAKNQQYLYLIITAFLLLFLGIGTWTYRKLRKQQKKLVSTNQIKNRLFSIIAHDLRGMIIPFQRSGKILKYHIQKENYDKTIELSQALEQNSERLSNMLDNLLNWSLEQMNGYKINPEKIIVGKELKDIISGYKQQASYKNTKLELKYKNELSIDFDKGAFHVIFRNLINNALKYTENGSIRIEFTTKGNVFVCSVVDTGIGMSSDQLTHLFALEERKSTIGTQGEKGTGLGLNLVYGFIKMHKGTITVSSEKRIGTRFDLSVPTTLTLIEKDSATTEPLSA